MSYLPATRITSAAVPFTPVDPNFQTFSWANQGSASVFSNTGSITMTAPGVAGINLRVREKTVPTAPYTVTVCLLPLMFRRQWYSVGVCLRDHVGGKVEVYDQQCDTSERRVRVGQYVNTTTVDANVLSTSMGTIIQFWQIADDNTNRTVSISLDGLHWQTLHQVVRTSYMTPTRIGWFMNAETTSGTFEVQSLLLSWAEA